MSHLKDLVSLFKETDDTEYNMRMKLVFEMMEYSLTYPPPETIEPTETKNVANCVHAVIKEVEDRGDHLLADRIHKIWKKREHFLQIAENAHHLKGDYMDDIEYHEEIKWIRDEIENFE